MNRVEPVNEDDSGNSQGKDTELLPPPSDPEADRGPPPERKGNTGEPVLSEEEARKALLEYVSENFCFGKGAAKDLQYTELVSSSALRYTLETFTEGRYNYWHSMPHRGQAVDGPENGQPPAPWDIPMQVPEMFKDTSREVRVPHTETVKSCNKCASSGTIVCYSCRGSQRQRCSNCSGKGRKQKYEKGQTVYEPCRFCSGQGNIVCRSCSGSGRITCTLCAGNGRVVQFLVLNVSWKTNFDDHVVEKATKLPTELIRSVTGQVTLEETDKRIWPIQNFKEQEINTASRNLIEKHKFTDQKILQQRQRVTVIPITRCVYKWKEKSSDYIVYGFENQVYAPDYPQTFCWGCSII